MFTGRFTMAVFAGDASGDFQAANLIRQLKTHLPGLDVWGVGGRHLQEAGCSLIYDTSRASGIGFMQVARLIPDLLATKAKALGMLAHNPPDLLLAVDFGAFNLRLTPEARRMGIPVAYWFPPGSWRKTPPSRRVVEAADFFISPFPWYAENLNQAGARAVFLGHPLLDQVKPRLSRQAFLQALELPADGRLVALLPGSRGHEVTHILPPLVEAAAILTGQVPAMSFVIPLADHFPSDLAGVLMRKSLRAVERKGLARPAVALARRATQEAICHADAAAVCSGSATLEAMIAGTPMVIVYRGSKMMKLEYKLRRMNIRYMGMPNILADADVVPELRQDEVNGPAVAAVLSELLADTPLRKSQIQTFASLANHLQPPGAIPATAQALLKWYAELGRRDEIPVIQPGQVAQI